MGNKLTKQQRRELAKRERLAAQKRARRRRAKTRSYGAGGLVLVIALIVLAATLLGGKNKITLAKVNQAAAAAGCSAVQTFDSEGRTHVPLQTTVQYKTNPPTSGNHYSQPGLAPTSTGVHPGPIQNEIQVHNLEHGHIGIQYKDSLDPAVRNALEDFTRKFDTRVFMAPKNDMPETLSFSAWTHLVTCNGTPNGAAKTVALAEAFRKMFGGKAGPEGDIPGTPITS